MRKKAFSLIEVVFASSFLIMVGVAMMSLNNAASRLITTAELKLTSQGLNDQAMAFLALRKNTLGDAGYTADDSTACKGNTCYVVCPPTNLASSCLLKGTRESVRVSSSKLSFTTTVKITDLGDGSNKQLVIAVTDWGNGYSRQVKGSRILE